MKMRPTGGNINHSKTQLDTHHVELFTKRKMYWFSSNKFDATTKIVTSFTSRENTAEFLPNSVQNVQRSVHIPHKKMSATQNVALKTQNKSSFNFF